MKPEDIGPILAMAERQQRKERRARIEKEFEADWNSTFPSQRVHRARLFANQVLGMMNRFTPEACHRDAFRELMLCAYDGDWEITQAPSERDAERDAALERARTTISPIFIDKTST